MRRMIIISAAALFLSMALCTFSLLGVDYFVDTARHMRTRAIEHMNAGEVQPAEEMLVHISSLMERWQPFLEIVCEHEDLHDTKGYVIEAQASIEYGSSEDFFQSIYRFGEMLEHLRDVESVRFSNFF